MSFTSSETIESFSSHCATSLVGRGAGLGEKEKGRRVKPSATQLQLLAQRVGELWGCRGVQVGGCSVFVYGVGGSRKEDMRNERVIPKLPEQFVTLEWLLSYPGGPLSRKVLRLSSGGGEGRGLTRQRAVGGHGLLSHQLCVRWSWRVAREEGSQKGGGQRVAACQGFIFIGMLVKPSGEISM